VGEPQEEEPHEEVAEGEGGIILLIKEEASGVERHKGAGTAPTSEETTSGETTSEATGAGHQPASFQLQTVIPEVEEVVVAAEEEAGAAAVEDNLTVVRAGSTVRCSKIPGPALSATLEIAPTPTCLTV